MLFLNKRLSPSPPAACLLLVLANALLAEASFFGLDFGGPFEEHSTPVVGGNAILESGNSDNGFYDDGLKLMCNITREPKLTKPLLGLFFYSTQLNSKGCVPQTVIELATINKDHNLNETAARESIQDKLLDVPIYDPAKPTYFVVHGYSAYWNLDNYTCNIKDLILDNMAANVFILDWSAGAQPVPIFDYPLGMSNAKHIGSIIGEFIEVLVQVTGQDNAERFRLIGHSLGAQLVGAIGYKVGSIGQIVSLEAGGMCYRSYSKEESLEAERTGWLRSGRRRVSPQAADFVLAIHTEGSAVGLHENMGHYDIYVNGGLKQPHCTTYNPAFQIRELFHGNALKYDTAFNCAHLYAQQVFDTFAAVVGSSGRYEQIIESAVARGELVADAQGTNPNKCYPMAYECSSWLAFRSGECGYCRDNDRHCVFMGLSYDNRQPKKRTGASDYERPIGGLDNHENDSVNNGEDWENDKSTSGNTGALPYIHNENTRGQHFIRAARGLPSCRFHYQIVIAVKRSEALRAGVYADKYHYYLYIPLERSGLLRGNGDDDILVRHARLAQVSHRIDPRSPTYAHLRTAYIDALKRHDNKTSLEYLKEDLDFYTALITFRSRRDDQCTSKDETNGQAGSRHEWQLCDTLSDIREASLWSPNGRKLEAVLWVALNFMSGVNEMTRLGNSYLMQRRGREIKRREQISEGKRARLACLRPAESPIKTLTDVVKSGERCLGSFFDFSDPTGSRRNLKCNLNDDELKYALELTPRRLSS